MMRISTWFLAGAWLMWTSSAVLAASQDTRSPSSIRVALVSAPHDGVSQAPESAVTFFEAVLQAELLQGDVVEVVERSVLGQVADELLRDASLGTEALRRGEWVGADWILRYQFVAGEEEGTNELRWRLFSTQNTGIDEARGGLEVAPAEPATLEAAAEALAQRLLQKATNVLRRDRVRTLVSFIGVSKTDSPVDWADWVAEAAAREVRREIRIQPDVLLLERQHLDDVFAEHRLAKAGLTQDTQSSDVEVTRFLVLSGRLQHEQPDGAPLVTRLHLEVTDLAEGRVVDKAILSFSGTQFGEMPQDVANAVRNLLAGDHAATPASEDDRRVEARRLMLRVLELADVNLGRSVEHAYERQMKRGRGFWGFQFDSWFVPDGGDIYRTPGRRARVRQALAYAQAAVMLDDNPVHQSMLAKLLADRDIDRPEDAHRVAHEVVLRFPGTEAARHAMLMLANSRQWPNESSESWVLPLVAHYARHETEYQYSGRMLESLARPRLQDRRALLALTRELAAEHQGSELEAAALRVQVTLTLAPLIDHAWAGVARAEWAEHVRQPSHAEALAKARRKAEPLVMAVYELPFDVQRHGVLHWWFGVTQGMRWTQSRRAHTQLHDPEVRERGHEVVRALIRRHPDHAPWLARQWGNLHWRMSGTLSAVAVSLEMDDARWEASEWWLDAVRLLSDDSLGEWPATHMVRHISDVLVPILIHHDHYDDAAMLVERRARTRVGVDGPVKVWRIQIAWGHEDWPAVLELLEARGQAMVTIDDQRRPAPEWAREARRQMGIEQEPTDTPSPHASRRVTHDWPIPDGRVSAIARVGDEVWVGSKAWNPGRYYHHIDDDGAPADPRIIERMLTRGGLVRLWPDDGRSEHVAVDDTALPHPWVTSIAVTQRYVYVGTFLAGLAVYDREKATWHHLNADNGLPSNHIRALAADEDQVWIGYGRNRRGGVARLDPSIGHVHVHLVTDEDADRRSPSQAVDHLALDGPKLLASGANESLDRAVRLYDAKEEQWMRMPGGAAWRGAAVFVDGHIVLSGRSTLLVQKLSTLDELADRSQWREVDQTDELSNWSTPVLVPLGDRLLLGGRDLVMYEPRADRATRLIAADEIPLRPAVTSAMWDGRRLWLGFGSGGQLEILDIDGMP